MNELPLTSIKKAVEDQKSDKEPRQLYVKIDTHEDNSNRAHIRARNPQRYSVTAKAPCKLADLQVFPEQGVILTARKAVDQKTGEKSEVVEFLTVANISRITVSENP